MEEKESCGVVLPRTINREVRRMTDNTAVSLNTPQDPFTELIHQGDIYGRSTACFGTFA